MNCLIVALLISIAPSHGDVDKAKLRQILKLPTVTIEFGVSYSGRKGYRFGHVDSDSKAEIARIKAEIEAGSRDADRYQRLGSLYAEQNDEAESRKAYARAVQLLTPLIQANPSDLEMRVRYSEALTGSGKYAEAEKISRETVKTSPGDWRAWLGLAQFLEGWSWVVLFDEGKAPPVPFGDYKKPLTDLVNHPPSPERVRISQTVLDESAACLDKAVSLAPDEVKPRSERALFRTFVQGFMRAALEAPPRSGETADAALRRSATAAKESTFVPGAISDFEEAARLVPDDPQAQAMSAIHAFAASQRLSGLSAAAAQTAVFTAIGRLEKIMQSNDKKKAAAADALGHLRAMLDDWNGAATALTTAVTLDPANERAWDTLILASAKSGRYDDMVRIGIDRLKQHDTPRNRLLLAKSYERRNELDKADDQVRAGIKSKPEDFAMNLARAILLLKNATDDSKLREAGAELAHAGQLYPKSPTQEEWTDYLLARSIYMALIDRLDEAREGLKQILEHEKDNEGAKEALAIIGN